MSERPAPGADFPGNEPDDLARAIHVFNCANLRGTEAAVNLVWTIKSLPAVTMTTTTGGTVQETGWP